MRRPSYSRRREVSDQLDALLPEGYEAAVKAAHRLGGIQAAIIVAQDALRHATRGLDAARTNELGLEMWGRADWWWWYA